MFQFQLFWVFKVAPGHCLHVFFFLCLCSSIINWEAECHLSGHKVMVMGGRVVGWQREAGQSRGGAQTEDARTTFEPKTRQFFNTVVLKPAVEPSFPHLLKEYYNISITEFWGACEITWHSTCRRQSHKKCWGGICEFVWYLPQHI